MKIKLALVAALAVGCALVGGCADTQKPEEAFMQSTEYDAVLQGDHGTGSWKKISREPSAIATPSAAAITPSGSTGGRAPAAEVP